MNPLDVINTVMTTLSVICATVAVVLTFKNMKMWRTQMVSSAAFPALADVLAKITTYEDGIIRLLNEAEGATKNLIAGTISYEEYRVLLKPIAEEKLPVGTLRDAGQLLELVYSEKFDNKKVVALLSDAKQIITPIRNWSQGEMLRVEVWNWIENQTTLTRNAGFSIEELPNPLFFRAALIQERVEEIRGMAKQCARSQAK